MQTEAIWPRPLSPSPSGAVSVAPAQSAQPSESPQLSAPASIDVRSHHFAWAMKPGLATFTTPTARSRIVARRFAPSGSQVLGRLPFGGSGPLGQADSK